MRIPRQSDRSGAPRAERPDAVTELRARRRDLVDQLRALGYWQRLVQARTDLSVAGLLYSAAAPTASPTAPWPSTPVGGQAGVPGLVTPPAGLDVVRLLCGPAVDGPGGNLDRLRGASSELVRHSRALQEELDEVTTALHAGLAAGAPAGTGVVVADHATDHLGRDHGDHEDHGDDEDDEVARSDEHPALA